jgi:peptide-methionine (S)-S-oxide reductase
MSSSKSIATLGGGCFWCLEAVFQRLKGRKINLNKNDISYLIVIGVEKVVSGYAGGHKETPSYEEVCTGNTNHAEVIQITFDPQTIAYKQLLNVFFHIHDPTTKNQ